jgi:hypothetical protein
MISREGGRNDIKEEEKKETGERNKARKKQWEGP